jgi:alanine racemase
MTLRLAVDSPAWNRHVRHVADEVGEILPVVKGNGYGFGRAALMSHAAQLAPHVAVGSVYELADVPSTLTPFVLTPMGMAVDSLPRADAVLSVTNQHDLAQLTRLASQHAVVVKVRSTMQRFGVEASEAASLRRAAEDAGHRVVGWSMHPPLVGTDDDHADEVALLAASLPSDLPIFASHIGAAAARLRARLQHRVVVRTGTSLWLGDKSTVTLQADVLAVRSLSAGSVAGYRGSRVDNESQLVMVGCGSSHGVTALDDGRSPFHFAKQRLSMLEAPHMHTTMLVTTNQPYPRVGDWVDVQQPMTRVTPDVTVWG